MVFPRTKNEASKYISCKEEPIINLIALKT